MKHLPKHLRPRWRYLAVAIETWPDADVDRSTFQRHAWYAAQNLLGDAAAADVDLTVVRFDLTDGTGHAIVRARRGTVDDARATLACLVAVDEAALGLRVLGVSGTVRACEEKYIGADPEATEDSNVVFEDAERTAVVRGERYDVRLEPGFAGATAVDFE